MKVVSAPSEHSVLSRPALRSSIGPRSPADWFTTRASRGGSSVSTQPSDETAAAGEVAGAAVVAGVAVVSAAEVVSGALSSSSEPQDAAIRETAAKSETARARYREEGFADLSAIAELPSEILVKDYIAVYAGLVFGDGALEEVREALDILQSHEVEGVACAVDRVYA